MRSRPLSFHTIKYKATNKPQEVNSEMQQRRFQDQNAPDRMVRNENRHIKENKTRILMIYKMENKENDGNIVNMNKGARWRKKSAEIHKNSKQNDEY